MKRNILVTGASGFIGSHLTEMLVSQGNRVRCLVKEGENAEYLQGLQAEIIFADILKKSSLEGIFKNIDVVYHLAAFVDPDKGFYGIKKLKSLYYGVNVTGTVNLIEAGLHNDIKKFIYFSSVASAGIGDFVTEDSPAYPITYYGKSKLAAELLLLEYFKNQNFPSIIIRPGSIFGPRDKSWLQFFKLFRLGVVPLVGEGNNATPICYIENLVNAALLIAERGRLGEIYNVVDDPCSINKLSAVVAEAMSVRVSKLHIPAGIVYAMAYLKELCERLSHCKVYPYHIDFSRYNVLRASTNWVCSNEKLKKELSYTQGRNLKEAITETIEWYKEHNLV